MSLPLPESLFLIKGIADFFWSILHPFHVFPPSGPKWLSLFSPRSLPFPLALKSLLPLAFPTKSPVPLGTLHRTKHAAVSYLKMCPLLLEFSLEWSPALFPIVDNIQQNLHGGGVCGFGVRISLIHSPRPHHPARRTQLLDWRSTTPLGSPSTVANQRRL